MTGYDFVVLQALYLLLICAFTSLCILVGLGGIVLIVQAIIGKAPGNSKKGVRS